MTQYFCWTGNRALENLRFTEATILHQLTLCMSFNILFVLDIDILLGVISTITSPVFRELVVELGAHLSQFGGASLQDMECWREVDKLLEEEFSSRGDFRLTNRTRELQNEAAFQRHARKCFLLLSKGGSVHFEAGHRLASSLQSFLHYLDCTFSWSQFHILMPSNCRNTIVRLKQGVDFRMDADLHLYVQHWKTEAE